MRPLTDRESHDENNNLLNFQKSIQTDRESQSRLSISNGHQLIQSQFQLSSSLSSQRQSLSKNKYSKECTPKKNDPARQSNQDNFTKAVLQLKTNQQNIQQTQHPQPSKALAKAGSINILKSDKLV